MAMRTARLVNIVLWLALYCSPKVNRTLPLSAALVVGACA